MFWPVWTFWTAVVPQMHLALPHSTFFGAALVTLLAVCAVALWFERDRPAKITTPHFDHGEEAWRLAA